MQRIDAKRGIASLCLGGGNVVSMLVGRQRSHAVGSDIDQETCMKTQCATDRWSGLSVRLSSYRNSMERRKSPVVVMANSLIRKLSLTRIIETMLAGC